MGQVRAEDSLARTFLYIVSIVTDPKDNAGTFSHEPAQVVADVTTMSLTDSSREGSVHPIRNKHNMT